MSAKPGLALCSAGKRWRTQACGGCIRLVAKRHGKTCQVQPKVIDFQPPSTMTWADGQAPMFTGHRVYRVEPRGTGARFTMTETFAGLMLPMIARTLPDFVPVFDQYAADLKAAAERAGAGR